MNYQFQNNNNFGLGGGVGFNKPPVKVKPTNGISEEEYRELIRNGASVKPNLEITKEDTRKAICTHRDSFGVSGLEDIGNGYYKCKACGRVTKPLDNLDMPYIEERVQEMIDIMETIKIAWQTIPEDILLNYFAGEAIIEKVPYLAKGAVSFMNTTASQNPYIFNNQTNNAFAMLSNIAGNMNPLAGAFNQGAMQQQWNPNFQQQGWNQQPMQQQWNPNFQQQQQGWNQQPMNMQQQMMMNNGGGAVNPFGNNTPDQSQMQQQVNNPNGVILPNGGQEQNNGSNTPAPRENIKVQLGKK